MHPPPAPSSPRPISPHSRIACYVTIFQNISNLRDIFYKEMSKVGPQSSLTDTPSPPFCQCCTIHWG